MTHLNVRRLQYVEEEQRMVKTTKDKITAS
jgi:hypothetical protein